MLFKTVYTQVVVEKISKIMVTIGVVLATAVCTHSVFQCSGHTLERDQSL